MLNSNDATTWARLAASKSTFYQDCPQCDGTLRAERHADADFAGPADYIAIIVGREI